MKDSEKFVITHGTALDLAVNVMHRMLRENGWLKIECKAGNRTLSQNALYWVWMTEIADFINEKNGTDFTKDELHIRMKHEFLGYDDPKTIGTVQIPSQLKSTERLSKTDMFTYMLTIDTHWANLGLMLSRPEDSVYAQLKRKNEGHE